LDSWRKTIDDNLADAHDDGVTGAGGERPRVGLADREIVPVRVSPLAIALVGPWALASHAWNTAKSSIIKVIAIKNV